MPTVETLNLPNFSSANILEELELNADAASGQKVIAVINSNNITDSNYLAINPGEETGEIHAVGVSGVSGNNITFADNLALLHRNHERVVKLYGNKINVYRAPNVDGTIPSDNAFSSLGSVTIDPDQPFSYYTDVSGGANYFYKFTYYNDVTSQESDLSLSQAVRGGGWGHYVSLDDIRAEAGLLDARRLDDTQVSQRRDEAEDEVKGALTAAGYLLPLQTSNGISFIPPIITGIARLLAAGLILGQNYGITKPGMSKDGNGKAKQARDLLTSIQNNNIILVDTNEQQLTKTVLVSGWPDDTTTDGPFFTIGKKF